MKQPLFSTSYAPRDGESTLDEIELLNIDDTVRHLIHEGTTLQLQQYLQAGQFYSFRQAAIEKVTTGVTTIDEVRRVLPYSALSRTEVAPIARPTALAIA